MGKTCKDRFNLENIGSIFTEHVNQVQPWDYRQPAVQYTNYPQHNQQPDQAPQQNYHQQGRRQEIYPAQPNNWSPGYFQPERPAPSNSHSNSSTRQWESDEEKYPDYLRDLSPGRDQ